MDVTRRRSIQFLATVSLPMVKPQRVYAQEPVTTTIGGAFVALALLQGAISYVGGKLMSSIMGDASIDDVKGWIQAAVAELERFVSAELKRQLDSKVIESMRADLSGVIENLREYSSITPANERMNAFLVQAADTKTASLLALALNYDQAIFISASVMAYRLIALYALFKLDKEPGHILSGRGYVDNFIKQMIASRDRIARSMSPEVRIVKYCFSIPPRGGPPLLGFAMCRVSSDGKQVGDDNKGNFGEQKRLSDAADAEIAQLAVPMRKLEKDFLDQANNAIVSVASCFDSMCKRVGSGYRAPPLGVITPIQLPAHVIFKGISIK
jgi:hypothetical protein